MGHLICIDPGHGGSDPGACAGADQEKYLTLEIAQRLQAELQRQGFGVCMTRESDLYNTPKQKAQFTNSKGADLFVSIHCNAAANQAARGTKTLSYGNSGESYRLAEAIQREVVAACGTADRGVKNRKDLIALNTTQMPAVLLETAFISNPEDRAYLRNAAWQRKVAEAVCRGICSYYGVEYQEKKTEKREDAEMGKEVPAWKAEGEKALRDLGLTIEPHDPEEVVDFGILGTILNKLQDRMK